MVKNTILSAFGLMACVTFAAASAPVVAADGPADFHVAAPTIPSRTFDITKYGAVGDGTTMNTAAIQKTIDGCEAAGGGIVDVPAGRFLTAPFHLASSINLHLESGATILFSNNMSDFKLANARYEDCLTAPDCHDVAITGAGTIDGQGQPWWKAFDDARFSGGPPLPHRPDLIVFNRCQRVLMQGVTLTNSPMFHFVPSRCQDVHIDGIHIFSPVPSPNTDGIDPSGWRYLIENSTIDTGDDCIAIKPTGRIDESQPACRDFLIRKMTFLHGHGMSVGGQTPGGLENLVVEDCKFKGTDAGIRLKASRGSGGLVENCWYRNLTMDGVKIPVLIVSYYQQSSPGSTPQDPAEDLPQQVTATTPIWRKIRIENVKAINAKTAGEVYGLPEMPVSDMILTDVSIQGRNGFQIIHGKDIQFVNSHVSADNGAPVILEDAQVTGISRAGEPVSAVPSEPRGLKLFDITKYGAVADGKTDATAAIAQAIDACAAAGGGRVVIPAGEYVTGPIHMKSNVDLHVSHGAMVTFTTDHSQYPLVVDRYEGVMAVRCTSPISGDGLSNISITGDGTFDGQGQTWRPAKGSKMPDDAWAALTGSGGYVDAGQTWWPSEAAARGIQAVPALQAGPDALNAAAYVPYRDFLRPTLVELDNCTGVVLDGPTFRNSPSWNVHIALSDNVTVRNITSFNYDWAQNGDGMDIDSCRHVAIVDDTVNAGDDGICLKSGKDAEGRKLGRPTQDVTIEHDTVFRGHGGLSIGSEMSGGVSKILLDHCVFDGTDVGLRMKSTRGRGGVVEDVVAHDVDMYDIQGPAISFDMYYMVRNPQPEPVSERTPRFRDFKVSDIVCDGAKSAILVRGLPEMPIENVSMDNVAITANTGVTCTDAKQIAFKDVDVTVGSQPTEILNETVDTTQQTASHTWQDPSGRSAQVTANDRPQN